MLWLGAALTVVGWVWGSFLNQLVDRLPAGRDGGESGGGPARNRITLLRPVRSICFACGESIPWYDNLPVLSYLLLRGVCRRCGASIGLRTLLMELAAPAGFAGLFWLRNTLGLPMGGAPGLAALELLLLSWLLVASALLAERRLGAGILLAKILLAGLGLGLGRMLLSALV